MRRLQGLLMAATLMAAPAGAVAGPGDKSPDTKSDDSTGESFHWSMSTSRARLGVMVIGLTPELRTHFGAPAGKGVLVARVEPKSSAAAAGLAVGDILTDVRGTGIDSAEEVLDALATAKKDDVVSLSVIRDKKPLTLSAKMMNDPAPASMRDMALPPWVKEWFQHSWPAPWAKPEPDKKQST